MYKNQNVFRHRQKNGASDYRILNTGKHRTIMVIIREIRRGCKRRAMLLPDCTKFSAQKNFSSES
jgi:hypothetical protein